MDRFDTQLLNTLQSAGRSTTAELAESVHLSPSQCQRRMKKLEETGIIKGYVALLDADELGLEVTAIVSIKLTSHGRHPTQDFQQVVDQHEEIMECHAVTGDEDYVLKIMTRDLKHFSDFLMDNLMSLPIVASVRSNVLLQELKSTTSLPINSLK
ncbi:MAG: Lrp/AsnC family leucine-responsive transcriptional regulator [Candidatus Azotimanducaceae bacterium]|jgi:Lrp/AsnC family leucine-responsive transcriptional regulator